jgi:putative membrane protein
VDNYTTAIVVAVILGLLNLFVKPLLVIFTLPVTIVTFGLFLLIINAIIILMADSLIDGFYVNGWISALIFSFLLTFLESILFSFLKDSEK